MPKLLIPTRNRATSLSGVLAFLGQFYHGTTVIIADGSTPENARRNQQVISAAPKGITMDYRAYPFELGYFDRLLDVLTHESDDHIVMGSDDDFPMMEAFQRGATYLEQNPDTVSVVPMRLALEMNQPGMLEARGLPVRSVTAERADRRASQYAQWLFPTTYAVTRRSHLIARYRKAKEGFLPGFYDFQLGAQDSIAGKIRGLPQLGFVTTRNYNHSYLRDSDGLFFLREAEAVQGMIRALQEDLAQKAPDTAHKTIERMIKRLIAGWCGAGPMTRQGFAESDLVQSAPMQKQIALFGDLFTQGTSQRAAHIDRLRAIARALAANAGSDDNKGEPTRYASLEGQMQSDTETTEPTALARSKSTKRDPLRLSRALNPDTLLFLPDEPAP